MPGDTGSTADLLPPKATVHRPELPAAPSGVGRAEGQQISQDLTSSVAPSGMDRTEGQGRDAGATLQSSLPLTGPRDLEYPCLSAQLAEAAVRAAYTVYTPTAAQQTSTSVPAVGMQCHASANTDDPYYRYGTRTYT